MCLKEPNYHPQFDDAKFTDGAVCTGYITEIDDEILFHVASGDGGTEFKRGDEMPVKPTEPPKPEFCQHCNCYKESSELQQYGALPSVCRQCRSKLNAVTLKKRQQSFFDDQPPLFQF